MPACLRMSVNFTVMGGSYFFVDWAARDLRASSELRAASSVIHRLVVVVFRGLMFIECGQRAKARFAKTAGGRRRKAAARSPRVRWREPVQCDGCRGLRIGCP